MTNIEPPDDLEPFLKVHVKAGGESNKHGAILNETLTVLRRRRRLRRAGGLARTIASFLVGAACMYLWLRSAPGQVDSLAVQAPLAQAPSPPPDEARPVDGEIAAVSAEWKAFDDPSHRREFYRQAGDLYLQKNHDYEAALRCYTLALDSGQDLTVSPDDNWLIMSLKQARQKEKNYDENDS